MFDIKYQHLVKSKYSLCIIIMSLPSFKSMSESDYLIDSELWPFFQKRKFTTLMYNHIVWGHSVSQNTISIGYFLQKK